MQQEGNGPIESHVVVIISWFNLTSYLESETLIALTFLCQFDSFWGYGTIQTALTSESNFGIRFVISNFNYPEIHVHVSTNSHIGGIEGQGDLQLTFEVKSGLKFELTSGLKFELSDLSNPCCHTYLSIYDLVFD